MCRLTNLLFVAQAYLSKFQCERNADGHVIVSYTADGSL